MQYASKRIINSVWILGYEVSGDDRISNLLHDRNPPAGHPVLAVASRLPDFDLVEVDHPVRRTVAKATIGGTTYEVDNPMHVFSYPKFE